MNFVKVYIVDGIATVSLSRGKVNAFNNTLVDELIQCLQKLESDRDIKAILLTGRGNFFSFGFDIPEFLSFDKSTFTTSQICENAESVSLGREQRLVSPCSPFSLSNQICGPFRSFSS